MLIEKIHYLPGTQSNYSEDPAMLEFPAMSDGDESEALILVEELSDDAFLNYEWPDPVDEFDKEFLNDADSI